MPHIIQLTVMGECTDSGANYSTFAFQSAAPTIDPLASMNALATNLRGLISNRLEGFLSSLYGFGYIRGRYWPDLNQPSLPTQVLGVTRLDGNATDAALAPRQTLLAQFSSFTLAPNRKRLYLGRYTEASNDTDGTPASNLIADYQQLCDDLLAPWQPINGEWWGFSVLRINQVNGHCTGANLLTSHLVNNKWAFLRTRDAARGI